MNSRLLYQGFAVVRHQDAPIIGLKILTSHQKHVVCHDGKSQRARIRHAKEHIVKHAAQVEISQLNLLATNECMHLPDAAVTNDVLYHTLQGAAINTIQAIVVVRQLNETLKEAVRCWQTSRNVQQSHVQQRMVLV
jgi:hypothetical protein